MWRQWKAMQGQLAQMAASGEQTKTLIEHASQQAIALRDAAAAMQESVKVEGIAAQASLRGMEQYKKQADIAARVAMPTLVIDKFETEKIGAADLEATLQFPKVTIVIKN